jgi:hypothetical protein
MPTDQSKLINDLVLYARTGKADKLGACIDQLDGDLEFVWGDYTPLGHAAQMGQAAAIDTLISRGALVSKPGPWGYTPLMLAALRGSLPSVRRLIEGGADADIKDSDGRTAIDFAREKGASDVVEFLSGLTSDPWERVDMAWIQSLDFEFADTITDFSKRAMESGERGEIQSFWESDSQPEWYRRLLASLPLAGICFSCSPAARDYDEEGRFLTVAELKEIPNEEPYLAEPFAQHALAPIADGSDGNHWAISLHGDHTSPVFIWDHSAMEQEKVYPNFSEFIAAAEFWRNNEI